MAILELPYGIAPLTTIIWIFSKETESFRRNPLNQTALRYFLEVYKYRNISKAALQNHISRQALSKTITSIEDEIGYKLFERTPDGLIPTVSCLEFAKHANNIINEYRLISNINRLDQIRNNQITVYTFDAVPNYLTADFFIRFNEEFPQYILEMQEMTEDIAINELLTQKCDLAIVTDAVNMSKVERTFLFRAQYVSIIDEDNPLSNKEAISSEDYEGQHVVGKSQELSYYDRDMNITYQKGADYRFMTLTNNVKLREEIVRKRHCVAVAWDYTALMHQPIEHCVVRPMLEEGFGCDVYLVKNPTLKNKKTDIFEHAILNWIDHQDVL